VPSRRPLDRLSDILENIERIEAYTADCDLARFSAETMRQDAVERCLLRLSEAARKLGPTAERLMPNEPWPAIRSIGNVLRHEYDGVDPVVIWGVLESDLGRLKAAVAAALDRLQGNPQG
jgi:uncharacterized protein with HEPN domain